MTLFKTLVLHLFNRTFSTSVTVEDVPGLLRLSGNRVVIPKSGSEVAPPRVIEPSPVASDTEADAKQALPNESAQALEGQAKQASVATGDVKEPSSTIAPEVVHADVATTDTASSEVAGEELRDDETHCAQLLFGQGSPLIGRLRGDVLRHLENVVLLHRLGDIEDLGEGVQLSYAQEGESLILNRFFGPREDGFFVDIGAHHPKRFSNTYSFYKSGWRGINIEPTPGAKELFDRLRPEDINLAVAVAETDGKQDFFMFSEPALNTFSAELASEYRNAGCDLLEIQSIETRRLDSLLHECNVDWPIDFMSIDVEGYELPVLQSNDWLRYRPKVLVVEILDFDLKRASEYPVHQFIVDEGYELFAKTYNTSFYKDIRSS